MNTAFLTGCAAALAVASIAPSVEAQQLVLGATSELGSGVEAGGRDEAEGVRRARTLLRVGADAHVDEFPNDTASLGLLLEMEPYTAAGVDLRYVRVVLERLALHVGAVGFIVPDSLVGVEVGFNYRLPLSESVELTFGPNIPVYFLGGDLPPGNVIFQGLVQAGLRAEL